MGQLSEYGALGAVSTLQRRKPRGRLQRALALVSWTELRSGCAATVVGICRDLLPLWHSVVLPLPD